MTSISSIHSQQIINPTTSTSFFPSGNNYYSDHNNINARPPPSSVAVSSRDFDVSKWRISASASASMNAIQTHRNDKATTTVFNEKKVDKWMQNSVVEIVKNLKEAPLLVHVYDKDDDDQTTTTTSLKTEKSVNVEDWRVAMENWGKKVTPLPQGVIFVQELDNIYSSVNINDEEDKEEEEDGITKAWGVVVQDQKDEEEHDEVECGPVCYLLKTNRVVAGGGYGSGGGGGGGAMACTHFCLMRVKSFRETALSQLKNSWLVQSTQQQTQ